MSARGSFAVLVVLGVFIGVQGEAYKKSVAEHLQKCYSDEYLQVRDNRLPMTMDTLISIIRKAENSTSPKDIKILTTSLLARYRQDGIFRTSEQSSQQAGLPYSAQGFQFYKYQMLMDHFVPGNAQLFPNETLAPVEECTLHYMVSSSFEMNKRADGDSICSSLSRYTDRTKRDVDDVDLFDAKQVTRCPVENGVVYTKWGAVNVGNLLAGIAAGLERQNVPLNRIAKSKEPNIPIDNLLVATIAGDISEVALVQPENKKVGAPGGWNDTFVPKWYLLETNEMLEMTDAEIRGGIDGFLLGSKIVEWQRQSSGLKLSQLLDMYYSNEGVFSKSYRACYRNKILDSVLNRDQLKSHAKAFGYAYKDQAKLSSTFTNEEVDRLTEKAADVFSTYITSINDVSCEVQDDVTPITRANLLIFVDLNWQFQTIRSIVNYMISSIGVNPYGSSYSVLNAADGQLLIQFSTAISEFDSKFNYTTYQQLQKGVDLNKIVTEAEHIMAEIINNDKNTNMPGGNSLVTLFVLAESTLSAEDKKYAVNRRRAMEKYIPDVTLLFLTRNKETYQAIVADEKDSFLLMDSRETDIQSSVRPVIDRVKNMPRRLTNPKCGSKMQGEKTTSSLEEAVGSSSINYYRVLSNYFFNDGDHAIKIKEQRSCRITVCHSRSERQPRDNATSVKCKEVTGEEYKISLKNACEDKDSTKDCAPLYLSVKGNNCSRAVCTNPRLCRTADSIVYTIEAENLVCSGSSLTSYLNTALLLIFVLKSLLNCA